MCQWRRSSLIAIINMDWTCSRCTFLNGAGAGRCVICAAPALRAGSAGKLKLDAAQGCDGTTTDGEGTPTVQAGLALTEGCRVEARWMKAKRWFPGTVVTVAATGAVDILYDDGDEEASVLPKYVRALAAEVGGTTSKESMTARRRKRQDVDGEAAAEAQCSVPPPKRQSQEVAPEEREDGAGASASTEQSEHAVGESISAEEAERICREEGITLISNPKYKYGYKHVFKNMKDKDRTSFIAIVRTPASAETNACLQKKIGCFATALNAAVAVARYLVCLPLEYRDVAALVHTRGRAVPLTQPGHACSRECAGPRRERTANGRA